MLALASLLALTGAACADATGTSTGDSAPVDSVPSDDVTTTTSSNAIADTTAPASTETDSGSGDEVVSSAIAPVFTESTFDVEVTRDVVYAQGQSHSEWGSDDAETIDLLLDVYEPVRSDDGLLPAVVMIHGGGFTGGSKDHAAMSGMAQQFAERGWVAYSIDYRLAGDHGTLPADYPEVPALAAGQQIDQWAALYPACRDAKAAVRWVRATASEHSVHPDYIAVVGGSAGSFLALTLGVSEAGDCVDELSVDEDPTLATTNLDQSSEVATVIDHWGGTLILSMLELSGGGTRFDATDAPISIVHGTEDPTVPFSEAERIRAEYEQTGVTYEWLPLEGAGHGAWGVTVDGQDLAESAVEFVIETQSLPVG